MSGGHLLTVREVDSEMDRRLAVLGNPVCSRPGRYGEMEGPQIEVDAAGYHYIVMERGQEQSRLTTRDLDELLYEVFSHITFELASNWEVGHRLRFKDSRRLWFRRQQELMALLSQGWGRREAERHAAILARHPFDDLAGEKATMYGALRRAGISDEQASLQVEQGFPVELQDFWSESESDRTGPAVSEAMVEAAESTLGYRLPLTYLYLLGMRNGGRPRRCCYPTKVRTSWAEDHIRLSSLLGVGFERGVDGEMESRYMIREWSYPEVGVVIADTPAGGHDAIMLDYSSCGPGGEPRVIHVETECPEPVVTELAPDFRNFAMGLVSCSSYPDEEPD